MYTTFQAGAATVAELGQPPEVPAPQKSRRKRAQVARACDWCRVHRIRCDNSHPCSRCIERGGECTVQGKTDIRNISSPQAYRTIERLEQRVRELEQELESHRNPTLPGGSSRASPRTPASRLLSTPPEGAGSLEPLISEQIDRSGIAVHEGIRIRTAQSQYETWYGPGSLYYFIRRMNDFLNSTLRQSRSINRMLPDAETNLFDEPTQSGIGSHNSPAAPVVGSGSVTAGDALTPTQEEYFISLYWQSYHTILFVLDEAAFKEHYHSLWTTKGQERKPSALVDIVIALCMQYGMASKPGLGQSGISGSPESEGRDPVVAGRWYYQRCQALLASQLESPTLITLQCQILSASYLCVGCYPNMADSACALAVRTAYMLGLHLEPPLDMPKRQREIRKRLWWALYVQDSKFSMKLGRPFLLNPPNATCHLPGDDREEALSSGSFFTPIGDGVTWLTFNVENIKLFQEFRAAYKAFYRGPGAVSIFMDQTGKDASVAIEAQANFVVPYLERIEDWVKGVPQTLTTKRAGNGVPFSTDGSAFEIEEFASLWLQRQRLLLELIFHHLSINLYRPFIRFGAWSADTPVADKYATQCAAHAITLTQAMHHVNKSTSILKGWNEAFQWQWNAVMSLVGFVFAYPSHPLNPAARNAIDQSVSVFESFGGCLSPAQKAVPIIRDLSAQADLLSKQTLGLESSVSSAQEQPLIALGDLRLDFENSTGNTKWGNSGAAQYGFLDELSSAAFHGMLSQSMDMAYSVDAQHFEMLPMPWPDVNSYQISQWT
ncbi:fungal-specific transcription factor domain-containing protein [Xylaria bambusicola]|uniref:fungal-specific transcription factor domain-containing protein n=1 Tax=Xylaria bambusicola TaxID=326684 RepID=UPI002008A5F7|nr:fungal-specific transcription factor domain-containing protein [Xylaria bambusicola]KAI0517455.1 fungal-specific transcription factor domain-containing protein [Xylaria bambusicola]